MARNGMAFRFCLFSSLTLKGELQGKQISIECSLVHMANDGHPLVDALTCSLYDIQRGRRVNLSLQRYGFSTKLALIRLRGSSVHR